MSKSPDQEADASTNASDKDVSVCPTCGEVWDSERVMKIHHHSAHGEAIGKKEYSCTHCGETFKRYPSNLPGENVYCSRKCVGLDNTPSGEDHHNYNRVEVTCESCGKQFERIASRAEKDETHYCDNDCRNQKVTIECSECGEEIVRGRHHLDRSEHLFCSTKCHDEFRRNGYAQYYGRNWNKQRQKAVIQNQGRCQICGKTAVDIGRDIDVHHLIPIERFKQQYDEPEWWERGNDLDNLITLCPPHHRKWEGIPLKPLTPTS